MASALQREMRRQLRLMLKRVMEKDRGNDFLDPVDDAVAPGYSQIIARPMCFRDVEARLEEGAYDDAGANGVLADVELIAANATEYNGVDSDFHRKGAYTLQDSHAAPCSHVRAGQAVVRAARTLLVDTTTVAKLPSVASTSSQRDVRRVLRAVLKQIIVLDKDLSFRDPVDLSAVPDYLDVVSRPMDFRTMEHRLEQGAYDETGVDGMLGDVELIAANATLYNGAESAYHEDAQAILRAATALAASAPLAAAAAATAWATANAQPARTTSSSPPASKPKRPKPAPVALADIASPPCCMCGKYESTLVCSKCAVGAHVGCVSLDLFKTDKATDRLVCQYCRMRAAFKSKGVTLPPQSEQECHVCSRANGGLFIPDDKNRFCHLACVLATPGLAINHNGKVSGLPKVVRVSHDSDDEDAVPCVLCASSKGVTSHCAVCGDDKPAHAACLLVAGGLARDGALLCAEHRSHAREPVVAATAAGATAAAAAAATTAGPTATATATGVPAAAVCGVCFSEDAAAAAPDGSEAAGEADKEERMLVCDACQCRAHAGCYGLGESEVPVDASAPWLCRYCRGRHRRAVQGACALCPHVGGVLAPVERSDEWCHVACVLWTPEASFVNPDRQFPVDVSALRNALAVRRNLTCSLCKSRAGACVQCCEPSCFVCFHALCAVAARLDGDLATFKLKCAKHSHGSAALAFNVAAVPSRIVGAATQRRSASGAAEFARTRPAGEPARETAAAWARLGSEQQRFFALAALDRDAARTAPSVAEEDVRVAVGRVVVPRPPPARTQSYSSRDIWSEPRDAVLERDVLSAAGVWRKLDGFFDAATSSAASADEVLAMARLHAMPLLLDNDDAALGPPWPLQGDDGHHHNDGESGALSVSFEAPEAMRAKPADASKLASLFHGSALAAWRAVTNPARLVLFSPPSDALVAWLPPPSSSDVRRLHVRLRAASVHGAWALLEAAAASVHDVEVLVVEPASEAQRLAWLQVCAAALDGLAAEPARLPAPLRTDVDMCALEPTRPVVSFAARVDWCSSNDAWKAMGIRRGPALASLRVDARTGAVVRVGLSTESPPVAEARLVLADDAVELASERVRGPGTVLHAIAVRRAQLDKVRFAACGCNN